MVNYSLLYQEGEKQVKKIVDATGIETGIFLDIGCGAGHVSYVAKSNGFYSIGLDPDSKRFEYDNNYVVGIGEQLPFRDNCFDVMCSLSVLEHVQDWRLVCKEIVRVLKRGGKLYIYFPNYLYPYERHFKVFFFPMPHKLARAYLSLVKRLWQNNVINVSYIDTIQYVTTLQVKKLFSQQGTNINDLSYQRNNWVMRFLARIGLIEGAWLVITK